MLREAVATARFIAGHPLSRGRVGRNLYRYAGWQVRSRLEPGPHIFQFVNDTRMYVASGLRGITGSYYTGLQEFEEMTFLGHLLRPDDLFVDVGANVGSYTILAAGVSGCDVLAFEPGEAAAWLARNVELNGLSARVELRGEAVGAVEGSARFTVGRDSLNRLDPAGTETVPVTTVDAACSRVPAAMKIDVEGAEADVLRGSVRTLSDPRLMAIVCEETGTGAAELLDSSRFSRCVYEPFSRRLTPTRQGEKRNRTLNGIFVRDIEEVRRRLSEAPALAVAGWLI